MKNISQLSCRKGNVLFFILIAVALFAALSYAVSNSFRGGTGTITTEQARVSAGELLRSMGDIRQGYQYLWVQQGCSLDDIDFTNPATTPFDCDMFHPQGAGVAYPNNLATYQTTGGSGLYTFYYVGNAPSSGYGVDGLGTSADDHMVVLEDVTVEICQAVNKMLDYDNFLDDKVDTDAGNTAIMGDINDEFDGQIAGCRRLGASGQYDVFYVMQDL